MSGIDDIPFATRHAAKGVPSLSKRLFFGILIVALAGIVTTAAALAGAFHSSIEQDAESDLRAETQTIAGMLNGLSEQTQIDMLQNQVSFGTRFTLVAHDGSVLYDSEAPQDAVLENHLNRPEIQEAFETGICTTRRYSETLETYTIYAAQLLKNGSVIRLAETRGSVFGVFERDLLVPLSVILLLAGVSVFALSRLLAKRVTKPFDQIDLEHPLDNPPYCEAIPLLARIDAQQTTLQNQNRQLSKAESMRRDFSANVSHEMKTPLQVISGYAELMKSGVVPEEDMVRFSAIIYSEAQSMRALIDDVLTLSQLDADAIHQGDFSPVDLGVLTKKTSARLEKLADDCSVHLMLDVEHVVMQGDEALLGQMIHNLIENAIRYNRPQGYVWVTVRTRHPNNDNPHAEIEIRDTGIGIPQKSINKIFERFYRVEKSRSKKTGGTGLGLAIAKHAALLHNGTITVESTSKGSRFTVCLPL